MYNKINQFKRKLRIAVLSVHPAPYRDPLISKLSESDDLTIHTYVFYDLDSGHKEWNYLSPNYSFTLGVPLLKYNGDYLHWNIIKKINTKNYDFIIIPGYYRLSSLFSILKCIFYKIPYAIIADSTKDAVKRNIFKDFLIKKFYDYSNFIWVPGKASRNYFQIKGYLNDKIVEGAYCLDLFSVITDQKKFKSVREKFRHEFYLNNDTIVFLAVGKFIEERKYSNLINSFIQISKDVSIASKIELLLVGDGGNKESLRDIVNSNGNKNIHFLGPVPFDQLSEIYSSVDVFIHPGEEPFSTAMEFAALNGLDIITTDKVGYYFDLLSLEYEVTRIEIDNIKSINDSILNVIESKEFSFKRRIELQNIAKQRDIQWSLMQLKNKIFKIFQM